MTSRRQLELVPEYVPGVAWTPSQLKAAGVLSSRVVRHNLEFASDSSERRKICFLSRAFTGAPPWGGNEEQRSLHVTQKQVFLWQAFRL